MSTKDLLPTEETDIMGAYKAITANDLGSISVDNAVSVSSQNVITAVSGIKDKFGIIRSTIIIDKLKNYGAQALQGKSFHLNIMRETGSMEVKE